MGEESISNCFDIKKVPQQPPPPTELLVSFSNLKLSQGLCVRPFSQQKWGMSVKLELNKTVEWGVSVKLELKQNR